MNERRHLHRLFRCNLPEIRWRRAIFGKLGFHQILILESVNKARLNHASRPLMQVKAVAEVREHGKSH